MCNTTSRNIRRTTDRLARRGRLCRRGRGAAWALALAALMGSAPLGWAATFSKTPIAIRVHVVDNHGKPVHYATVAATLVPSDPDFPNVSVLELWHEISSDPSSWGLFTRFSTPDGVDYVGLTDAQGQVVWPKLSWRAWQGVWDKMKMVNTSQGFKTVVEQANIPRPEVVTVAFVAGERGYDPGRGQIKLRRDQYRGAVKIVLKRNGDYRATWPAYVRDWNEVRAGLSRLQTKEETSNQMTDATDKWLAGLKARLQKDVAEAVKAGDRVDAARIEYWISLVPNITERNGQVVGYREFNAGSDQYYEAVHKAAELDPESVYFQAAVNDAEFGRNNALHKAGKISNAKWIAKRAELLKKSLALENRAAGKLWWGYRNGIAQELDCFEHYPQAIREWKWLVKHARDASDKNYAAGQLELTEQELARAKAGKRSQTDSCYDMAREKD